MIFVLTMLLSLSPDLFRVEDHTAEIQKWRTFLLVTRENQTRLALTNANTYVPEIAHLYQKYGVPEDMVWIGLIESSFRPSACSNAQACGMFQFKKQTARAFGLKVNAKVDERLNPVKSAEASAQYLAYLGKKFQDWDLVLAAYNVGEGTLYRTMKAHKATTWEQVQPFVRVETQNYVAKIKAAAQIGKKHMEMTMDGELDHLKKGVRLQNVFGVYPEYVDASTITPASQTNMTTTAEVLADFPKGHTHQVKKGDSLYSLARHYKVNLKKLRLVNNIKGNYIDVGQRLIIP